MPPRVAIEAVAGLKVLAAAALAAAGELVLAADTMVFLDDEPLGQPRDAAGARRMLARLSGRSHEVVTAVALLEAGGGGDATMRVASEAARVTFRALSPDEIEAYVSTGEPLDKAGAYAIQGGARGFVTKIEGAEDVVVGLPVSLVRRLLAASGA